MNRTKVTLEVFDLDASLVIELVELQVLAPANENLLIHVKGCGVGWTGNADFLQLLKPEEYKSSVNMEINYLCGCGAGLTNYDSPHTQSTSRGPQ